MKYTLTAYYGDNQTHVIEGETDLLAGGLSTELSRVRQHWVQQYGFQIPTPSGALWVLLSDIHRVVIEAVVEPPSAEIDPAPKPKKTRKQE